MGGHDEERGRRSRGGVGQGGCRARGRLARGDRAVDRSVLLRDRPVSRRDRPRAPRSARRPRAVSPRGALPPGPLARRAAAAGRRRRGGRRQHGRVHRGPGRSLLLASRRAGQGRTGFRVHRVVRAVINDTAVRESDLRGRRVTIVGLGKGRTSRGLAEFLARAGAVITVTDTRSAEELAEGMQRLGDLPVAFRLGTRDDDAIAEADYVFVIPGTPPTLASIVRAENLGIPVLTEIGVFFGLCPAPIVGVTGTKGKTTTTTLIGRVLAEGDRPVIVAGDIGGGIHPPPPPNTPPPLGGVGPSGLPPGSPTE